MRTWRHSHNLAQNPVDRIDAVIVELSAERDKLQQEAPAGRPALHRVEAALSLLEQARAALAG